MPYIKQKDRAEFNEVLKAVPDIINTGNLNYIISKLCIKYLHEFDLKYSTINEIIGVLNCVQQEFYRKIACDYEDKKEIENGTIWQV